MDLLTGEVLDLARDIKSCASLGIGPLSEYSQLEIAERLDADMATTSGSIKPLKNPGILADMHTHSRNSHDASFPVLEIADAAAAGGVTVMAVADHCDMFLCTEDPGCDIYSNQIASYEEAKAADRIMGDRLRVLAGIEMGGYLITLSTDAHEPERSGANFLETAEILRRMGFRNIFYYQNRRCIQCAL